jgi:hypothetical protein
LTLTREAVLEAVAEHRTYPKAAEALGVTPDTLTNTIYRKGWKDAIAEVRDGRVPLGTEHEIRGTGPLPLGDIERLLKERGLDGSRWIAGRLRVGEWEAQKKGGDRPGLAVHPQARAGQARQEGQDAAHRRAV